MVTVSSQPARSDDAPSIRPALVADRQQPDRHSRQCEAGSIRRRLCAAPRTCGQCEEARRQLAVESPERRRHGDACHLSHGQRGYAGSWMQVVVVGWNTHPDARVVKFEVQYQFDGTTYWIDYGSSLGVIVEITDELGNGAFNFRVRAVAFDGSSVPEGPC